MNAERETSADSYNLTYAEMLLQMVDTFEEHLPEELTFEDTIEIGIDAWNLANRKAFLSEKNLYAQQLNATKFKVVIEKMVGYKIERFLYADDMITDYAIEDNILKVETKDQKEFFSSLINQMINLGEDED